MMRRVLTVLVLALVLLGQSGTVAARPTEVDELRAYLYQTAPYPEWQDATIWCESRWQPDAYNPQSGASGISQFIPSTWAWASDHYGIYGSPFDPYVSIDLMNALWADGFMYWWVCA